MTRSHNNDRVLDIVPEAPETNGADLPALSDIFPQGTLVDAPSGTPMPVGLVAELKTIHEEAARVEQRRMGLIRGWCFASGMDPETARYDLTTGLCTGEKTSGKSR